MSMIEIEFQGVRQMVDEKTLVYTETREENDKMIVTAQEWRRDGVLVKRNAHVMPKRWPEGMDATGQLGKLN